MSLSNTTANLLIRASAIGSQLALVPIAITVLGKDAYGLWMAATSISALAVALDFGTLNAAFNIAARYRNQRVADLCVFAAAKRAALVAAVVMASIAAVAMISDVSSLLNTQQSLHTARASVLLVCGLSLLALPFSVFNQLRLGRMQASRVAPALIAGNLCGFFAALAASRLTDSPLAFIASAAWPPVLSQIFVAVRTRVSEARLPSRCTNAPLVRANRRVRLDASPFFVTQLATLGSFHVDNLIVAAMLSSSQAAEYSLTNRYFSIISILLSVYLATAWPQYAKLQHLNDRAALHRVFWRNVIGSVVAAVVCSVVLIAVSSPFFRTWTRASVLPNSDLMLAMAAFAIVNAALGNVSVLLSSMGSVRIQAVVSTAMLLPNVGLSIVLVREVGVAGPVIASALCASLMLTTYLLYWNRSRREQRS